MVRQYDDLIILFVRNLVEYQNQSVESGLHLEISTRVCRNWCKSVFHSACVSPCASLRPLLQFKDELCNY